MTVRRWTVAAVVVAGVTACASGDDAADPTGAPMTESAAVTAPATVTTATAAATTTTPTAPSTTGAPGVERLVPRVVATIPHDRDAFTQGLLVHDGRMYESTGQYGASELRELDLATGEVLRRVAVPPVFFAEGLARVGDRLVQLTWQEGTAFVYDLETFEVLDRFRYEGEGWGLCHDGDVLYMSDGSSALTLRDPATFDVVGSVDVRRRGRPVDALNELECAGGHVYANVWQTDTIVEIDPADGRVVAEIDATGLLPAADRAGTDVLNGIAAAGDGRLYLTGKYWPTMFEVELVPA